MHSHRSIMFAKQIDDDHATIVCQGTMMQNA